MYAPGLKVYISTASNGIIDISDDVTQGTLVRRSSGVSTFQFMLQNARRKYDGVFTPNDRIIVMMKRLAWMRVFTGYLNSVPLVTAWPTAVQITASCSLKRLQYWYWDPGLAASQAMIGQAIGAAKGADDGGTSAAAMAILNNVVGWPSSKVHIAGIPQEWMTWAYKIAKNVNAQLEQADQLAQQFYAQLGANGIVGGVLQGGAVASNALKGGTYGTSPAATITSAQAAVAVTVFNAGVSLGAEARDQVVAIAVCYQESRLGANEGTPGGTGGSVGIFQQTPDNGWGTAAQLANNTYAAAQFYKALLKISSRDSMTVGAEGQAVQRSGVGAAAYQQWSSMATSIVNVLSGGQGSGSGAVTAPAVQGASSTKTGKAEGAALLQTAVSFVEEHPHIPYQYGGDSAPQTPAAQVTCFDCSSFVQWVYYHTLGSLGQCPRTSEDQSSWCKSSGTIVTAAQGMNIQGALMFKGSPGQATHVEISLGDGEHTVGFHYTGTDGSVVASDASYWTCGGLAPSVDYSGATGYSPSATSSTSGFQIVNASQEPWYNPSDRFDSLFGGTPWVASYSEASDYIGTYLSGPRALLADQPLLPYLKNLMSSCMRMFSSAPNGDFIAWFPDYYGIWGTAAIMQVEPIELQDFSVWWDDTQLVTHQFTVAPYTQEQLDLTTGQVASSSDSQVTEWLLMTTSGVATIDIPAIMYALFGLEATTAQAQKFIAWVYQRFGARPNFQQMPGVIGPQGEFFSALFLFMQSWAYQYGADIPITFMPELWPGMLIQIPSFGFQAYVTTVTHQFQMGPGGGFTTVVNIAAPARLPGNDANSGSNLIGMPIAGGLVTPS
jgi:cell wall-associated NlpC family hydrolase